LAGHGRPRPVLVSVEEERRRRIRTNWPRALGEAIQGWGKTEKDFRMVVTYREKMTAAENLFAPKKEAD